MKLDIDAVRGTVNSHKSTLIITEATLQVLNKIIDDEMKVARELNPQMAMGMLQIKKLINEEFSYVGENQC